MRTYGRDFPPIYPDDMADQEVSAYSRRTVSPVLDTDMSGIFADMQTTKKTIVVADDHGIMRDGLCALINGEPDLKVIGTATNGREAIRAAEVLKPDLVMMDMSMPLTNGPEAIAHIKRRTPEQRILVLTFHTDDQHIHSALRAGADGYVLKDDSRLEMLTAVRAVLNGKSFLSPAICDRVVNGYLSGAGAGSAGGGVSARPSGTQSSVGSEILSQREREVIKLIAEGYRTREIATFLSLSHKTVEKHRSNLMRKLNLRSAAAVTAYAIANGFVRP
jgi:two-component system, NarL family, response regulator NreC